MLPSSGVGAPFRVTQSNGGMFRLERGTEPLASPVLTVLKNNNDPNTDFVVAGSFNIVETGSCLLPSAP